MYIMMIKYFISRWKDYQLRFICLKKDKSYHQNPLSHLALFLFLFLFFWIGLGGRDVFLNCLCLNTFLWFKCCFVCWDQTVVNKLYKQASNLSFPTA